MKTYSDRYWEMFNAIDDDFDDVAINTFKLGLPAEHGLRKSLTEKLVISISSWIRLTSIRGLKRTSNKARERVRLSFRKGGISG